MKRLIIAMMCLGVAGYVSAQEAESAPAEEAAAPAVPTDGGTEAVAEAQATKTPVEPFKDAAKVLGEVAKEKKWRIGWDRKKGRIIKIESAEFKCNDPATDKKFFLLRDMAAKKAVLKAKVGIIETFSAEMSGSDMLDVPGSDVEKELGAERKAASDAVEAQKKVLVELLKKTDKAEADALNGTTFGQRLDDMMSAIIKKLDVDYNANQHDEAAKARFENVKKQYAEAVQQYKEIKAKADKMQKALKSKQTSATTKMAKMPLFGASVIMQTESWDKTTKRYQVAVLVTWSKVLEEAARAIATGNMYTTKPGPKSVNDWLDDQDLGSMVGPRQYVDDEGNRWFLGISSRRYTDSMSSSARDNATALAEMSASQMAIFSIFADLESFKEAKAVVETRGDADEESEEENVDVEKMARKLSQTFKNKKVNGLQELASQEVQNAISGQTVYVKVYGINANDAMDALKMEDLNIATKIESNRYQTQLKGRDAANQAAIKASENRPEDFASGAQKQTGKLADELKGRRSKKSAIIQRGSSVKQTPGSVKSTSGTFGGDANVGDDF